MNFLVVAAPALAALFFALGVLFRKNLYAGAICLLAALLQVAAIFYALGAHLLAMIQVLVYAGAVMVLVVVAIMASTTGDAPRWAEFRLPPWLAGAAVGLGLIEAFVLYQNAPPFAGLWPAASPNLEREMAGVLFGPYALLTEVVGLVVVVSALAVLQE